MTMTDKPPGYDLAATMLCVVACGIVVGLLIVVPTVVLIRLWW